MKRFCFVIFTMLCCSLSVLPAQRQTGICNTTHQNVILDRLTANRELMAEFSRPRNAITYVPIKVQLVARNDGTGRAKELDVLEMLCVINEEYLDQDIQFYFSNGFRYVDDTEIYSNPSPNVSLISNNKVNNAINIFIIGKYNNEGGQAFYSPSGDYIIADKAYIRSESVVPHELGHFFSLAHPFYGWEGHPYDPAEHGNPVGLNAPSDPNELGPVGNITNEKQSGSNCHTSADRICDTKPDYLFAFSDIQNNTCMNYPGNTMDPDGVVVDPVEMNMMSYFNNCTDYVFTPNQKTAIELDLFSPARNHIRPNYTPNAALVTEDAELVSPINGEITAAYNNVKLQWNAPPNAESYIVQVDLLPTFNLDLKEYIIKDQTFLELLDLVPERKYYWRVRPFSELSTCQGFSATTSFVTGIETVNTRSIESVNAWTVMPNPVHRSAQLEVQLDVRTAFEGDVKLYSMTGQLVQSEGTRRFAAGANNFQVNINELSRGMYFLMIESAEGLLSEKVVLVD